jgi:hypothetical protein
MWNSCLQSILAPFPLFMSATHLSESFLCGIFNSIKPLQRAVPVELLAQVPVCLVSCEIRVKRPTFPISSCKLLYCSCFITLQVRPV